MTDTELTVAEPQPRWNASKHDPNRRITAKVRAGIKAMVWDGLNRAQAAQAAELKDGSLYAALRLPHVKAYYLAELEVLRTSERARNIHVLAEVRDQRGNQMARVQAVKALEELEQDQAQRNTGTSHSPGVTIRVINVAAPVQADARQRVIAGTAHAPDHPSQLQDGTGGEKP